MMMTLHLYLFIAEIVHKLQNKYNSKKDERYVCFSYLATVIHTCHDERDQFVYLAIYSLAAWNTIVTGFAGPDETSRPST